MVLLKAQDMKKTETKPFWQRATSKERAQDFREWASQLSRTSPSLLDEAFDRNNIYD